MKYVCVIFFLAFVKQIYLLQCLQIFLPGNKITKQNKSLFKAQSKHNYPQAKFELHLSIAF